MTAREELAAELQKFLDIPKDKAEHFVHLFILTQMEALNKELRAAFDTRV